MRLPLLLALSLLAMPSIAQELHESMQPYEYLVGQWEGPAWYLTPTGQRVDVVQTEDVYAGAGGHIIVVQGTGYLRQADGTPGEAAFNAFGVMSHDAAAGGHFVDAFNEGRHIRTAVTPTDGGFEWAFEAGGRRVRYVMHLDDDGRWVETGEAMIGPESWVQFVEMTLSRVGE